MSESNGKFSHETVERKVSWLGVWIVIVIAIGGLVEIVPLYASSEITTPAPGVKPYPALALEGRDIYIREGCYGCHSQMIRTLRAETERYGHFSLPARAFTTTPSSSAPSVPGRISLELAGATATNGIAPTS